MSVYPGNLLTATAATVTSPTTATRTWSWLRNGAAIPSATSATYTVTQADIGAVLTAVQTETNFVGNSSASSVGLGPVQTFNPTILFSANEPGIVLDPSDATTLFQDTAGTTPVTAPGQPVGLALDKSRGLVLGPELVTNGNFSAGSTGWTTGTNWTITGGAAVAVATSSSLLNAFTCVAGRTYRVDFDVVSYASGDLLVTVGGNYTGNPRLFPSQMAPGRKSVIVVAGSDLTRGVEFYGGLISAAIDNVSVRELPGNHAVQTTLANRPIYALLPANGVRNVLTGSAAPADNTFWTTSGTVNGVTISRIATGVDTNGLPYVDYSVSGTASVDTYIATNSNASCRIPAVLGQTYTTSCIAQIISGTAPPAGNGPRVEVVELDAGSVFINGSGAPYVTTTEQVNTCTHTASLASVAFLRGTMVIETRTGVTVNYVFRMKALQFERGSTRTAYQFNYSFTNVAEPPFAQVGALYFDGSVSNRFLQTPSVNFESYTWDGLARRNFALGSAQPSNDGFWPASATLNGITVTKVASGFDVDGLPYADVRYQGTATGTFNNLAYSNNLSRVPASLSQTFTGGAVCRLVAGSTTGISSLDMTILERDASLAVLASSSASILGQTTDTLASVTRTTNQPTVAFVDFGPSLVFNNGATIDVTYRIKAVQFEQAATRSTWQGTGTDKATFFAGVRKLSDAARSFVFNQENGGAQRIAFEAPNVALGNYTATSGGTTNITVAVTQAAPNTSVLSASASIAPASLTLKQNGVQVAQSTSTQGTGNYSNQPIYIGRFAGISFPLNGYLYSLIIRGAATPANLITATETWVNSRTGAY